MQSSSRIREPELRGCTWSDCFSFLRSSFRFCEHLPSLKIGLSGAVAFVIGIQDDSVRTPNDSVTVVVQLNADRVLDRSQEGHREGVELSVLIRRLIGGTPRPNHFVVFLGRPECPCL